MGPCNRLAVMRDRGCTVRRVRFGVGCPTLVCLGRAATANRLRPQCSVPGHIAAESRSFDVKSKREMVEVANAPGRSVRYTAKPNAKHDSWTMTHKNREFYTWLLEQKRES
jgi:hypothetical protein